MSARRDRDETSDRDRDDDRSSRGRGDSVDRERERSRDDGGRDRERGRDDDSRPSRDSGRDRDRDRGHDDDRSRDRDTPRRGGREEEPRGGRDRDDDRSSRSSRDDDDRGGRGGKSFTYEKRSREDFEDRQSQGGKDYDKFLKGNVKKYVPKDGLNRIRILPPTWKGAKHYALAIYLHYGVGPDRQSYLCLSKMKGEADPIQEEYARVRPTLDSENKDDQETLRQLNDTKRALMYVVDRDNEKLGVQAWDCPWSLDSNIVKVSEDRSSGEVFNIDDPEHGYDVEFDRVGKGRNTRYEGVAIARRSSRLGKDEWLEHAVEHPLPDILNYFSYDHIAKAFGGGGSHRPASRGGDRDDDRSSRGGRDRDDSDTDRGRDRDADRGSSRDSGSRDRDDRSRDAGDSRGRGSSSSRDDDRGPKLTWESIHDMTRRELEDLVDQERLTKIDPRESPDAEDLANWVCEEMKITKPASRERVRDDDTRDRGRSRDDEKEDLDKKMADMRSRRDRD